MTAPVIFQMFLNVFGLIVLNDNYLTTLIFDEPVNLPHSGASRSELYLKKSTDGRKLFLKSLGKPIETNLTVPTESGKLYSFIIRVGERPHSIIKIKDGKRGEVQKYRSLIDAREYQVLEGDYTVFKNKIGKSIYVNGTNLSPFNKMIIPNGSPVFVEKKRVLR